MEQRPPGVDEPVARCQQQVDEQDGVRFAKYERVQLTQDVTLLVKNKILERSHEKDGQIGCDDTQPDGVAGVVECFISQQDKGHEQIKWHENTKGHRVQNQLIRVHSEWNVTFFEQVGFIGF